MTFAQRQTVANELFTRLEQLFSAQGEPDSFTLAKLRRDVDALEKVDAASASMVRAGVAALTWDQAETVRWVNNSLRLNGSLDSLHNAGLTYKQINLIDRNAQCVLSSYTMAPKNELAVALALEGLCICGRFAEAHTIYQRALTDGVPIDHNILRPGDHLQQMAGLGIEQQQVTFELAAAHQVLTNGRKRARNMDIGVYTDHDGLKTMLIQLEFVGTNGEELRLESALAQLLADSPCWNPNLLSTELKHVVVHANEYA